MEAVSRTLWHLKSKGTPNTKCSEPVQPSSRASNSSLLFTWQPWGLITPPLLSTFIQLSLPIHQPLPSTLDRPVCSENMPEHSHLSLCNQPDVSLPRVFPSSLSSVCSSAPISNSASSRKPFQMTPGVNDLSCSTIYIIHCFHHFGCQLFSIWPPIHCFVIRPFYFSSLGFLQNFTPFQ